MKGLSLSVDPAWSLEIGTHFVSSPCQPSSQREVTEAGRVLRLLEGDRVI